MSDPGDPSPAPQTRARVLLVDNDPLIAELVVDMLDMEGYNVDTATNGIEALQRLEGQRYDLIITDLHMPKLDGSGFYRELSHRKVLHGKRAQKGVFITTGVFSAEAGAYVDHIDPKVVLIDGRRLAELMIDFDVGVNAAATYSVKRVDSDYFDDSGAV